MVNVKNSLLPGLRQSIILATIARALYDFRPQPGEYGAHDAKRSARNRSSVKNSARLTRPSASARRSVESSGAPLARDASAQAP